MADSGRAHVPGPRLSSAEPDTTDPVKWAAEQAGGAYGGARGGGSGGGCPSDLTHDA